MIMTDDQEAVSAREMPKMQALIAAQGVTFQNAISTTPLCSPSRATVLSGRYAHSRNILSNQPPLGGYGKYRDSGMEGDSHEEEYYDFKGDPYQMNSAVGSHPSEVNRLNARMKTLAACRGASCR